MGHLTEKMVLVPEYLPKCLVTEGFINEVRSRISRFKTQREAYDELEEEMETYFHRRKFKDYQTFRVMQTRFNKRKKS